VFEFDQFAKGTEAIAQTLADLTRQGVCIIGGGDPQLLLKGGVAGK